MTALVSGEVQSMDAGCESALAIVTVTNLYHDFVGLVPLTALQSGRHFLATVPAGYARANHTRRSASGCALVLALQGSVEIAQNKSKLHVARTEVASFDACDPYTLENRSTTATILLLFVP